MTKELGIYMIVDEVQTGVGCTGKFWGHDHWNLESPPDFVTFAKKMLSCGFYHTDETRMATPMRVHNTFFGDPVRALLTVAQNETILEDNLPAQAKRSGDYLYAEMQNLATKHPDFIGSPRAIGTFQAFDVKDVPTRTAFLNKLKEHGVHAGPVGSASGVRLRPCLYFEEKHADLFVDRIDKTCKDLS